MYHKQSDSNIPSSAISNFGAKTGTMLCICCSTKVECIIQQAKSQRRFNKSQNSSKFVVQQMLNRVSFALQQQVFCIKVACEDALQWGKSAKINQRAK